MIHVSDVGGAYIDFFLKMIPCPHFRKSVALLVGRDSGRHEV